MHVRSVLSVVIALFAVSLIWTACSKASEDRLGGGTPVTPATCDTANMQYVAHIQPILNAAGCTDCHSSAIRDGGVVLDTYAGIKTQVNNGRFLGAITHASGYVPMPYGGSKLPDCTINKVKAWVARGAQNN